MKTDCFAISGTKKLKCTALNTFVCKNAECSFYKTRDTLSAIQRKNRERLNSLDVITQRIISDTYYGGNLPWEKGYLV